jgi:AraC-like DNA-binding protein
LQTGKTAKEHIQARIALEAKRLLHFSDLSVKEIGFQLGFPEPANFSAFFKKCTGSSPSNFKSK